MSSPVTAWRKNVIAWRRSPRAASCSPISNTSRARPARAVRPQLGQMPLEHREVGAPLLLRRAQAVGPEPVVAERIGHERGPAAAEQEPGPELVVLGPPHRLVEAAAPLHELAPEHHRDEEEVPPGDLVELLVLVRRERVAAPVAVAALRRCVTVSSMMYASEVTSPISGRAVRIGTIRERRSGIQRSSASSSANTLPDAARIAEFRAPARPRFSCST